MPRKNQEQILRHCEGCTTEFKHKQKLLRNKEKKYS